MDETRHEDKVSTPHVEYPAPNFDTTPAETRKNMAGNVEREPLQCRFSELNTWQWFPNDRSPRNNGNEHVQANDRSKQQHEQAYLGKRMKPTFKSLAQVPNASKAMIKANIHHHTL